MLRNRTIKPTIFSVRFKVGPNKKAKYAHTSTASYSNVLDMAVRANQQFSDLYCHTLCVDPGLNPPRAATTTNGHPFTFQNSNRGICVYKSIKRINPHKNFQCMKRKGKIVPIYLQKDPKNDIFLSESFFGRGWKALVSLL